MCNGGRGLWLRLWLRLSGPAEDHVLESLCFGEAGIELERPVQQRLRALEILLLDPDASQPQKRSGVIRVQGKYAIELDSRLGRLPGGGVQIRREKMSDATFRRLLEPLGHEPDGVVVGPLVAQPVGLAEERGRRARANRTDCAGDATPAALEKRRQVHQFDFLRARRTGSGSKGGLSTRPARAIALEN